MNYSKNELNTVKRSPKRGIYDKEKVFDILDRSFIAYVSYSFSGHIITIPTAYGRLDESIYIHGAISNRMIKSILEEKKASFTVSILNDLVLAKSAFHHSMNYESVVAFCEVENIESPDEKYDALKCISENILKGRWEDSRKPNDKELKATAVVKLNISEAAAKCRYGDPIDDKEDEKLKIWSGLLPINDQFGSPIADSLSQDISIPDYLKT